MERLVDGREQVHRLPSSSGSPSFGYAAAAPALLPEGRRRHARQSEGRAAAACKAEGEGTAVCEAEGEGVAAWLLFAWVTAGSSCAMTILYFPLMN